MSTTDTTTQQLVINRLTKTQFNGATPSNTELWAVDPEFAGGKLLATDANGDIVESAIASNVTIPTVNNGTLTIQKNGTTVSTFTANSSTNVTANITVPTVNDATITITQGGVTKGSFSLNQASGDTIALDAGGSTYTAGTGIDITSNVLSVTGVKDQRTSNAIKTWTGTKAQYDAIATKDANTIYNITDDTTPSNFANIDLSNLSQTGQAVIDGKANTSLSNLDSAGQALFTSKLDANKIQQVSTLPVNPVADTLYLIPE